MFFHNLYKFAIYVHHIYQTERHILIMIYWMQFISLSTSNFSKPVNKAFHIFEFAITLFLIQFFMLCFLFVCSQREKFLINQIWHIFYIAWSIFKLLCAITIFVLETMLVYFLFLMVWVRNAESFCDIRCEVANMQYILPS